MYTAYYFRLINYIAVQRKEITDFHMYSRDIYVIHYNEKTKSASFLYKSAIQLNYYIYHTRVRKLSQVYSMYVQVYSTPILNYIYCLLEAGKNLPFNLFSNLEYLLFWSTTLTKLK